MATRILCTVAFVTGLFVASVEAQIWDGGGAAGGAVTWTTAVNWDTNFVPANNGTANISMAGAFDVVNTVDVNFDINSLTFSAGGGPFVINNSGGATLTIRGGGITNSNALLQTINAPLILSTGQTWNASAGALTIGGTVNLGTNQLAIMGSPTTTINGVVQNTTGSIVINAGNLNLANNNLFTGGLTLNAGTLTVSNNGAAGTGTLTIIGGTIQAGTSPKTLSNTVTLGGNLATGGPFDLNFSGAATLTGNRTVTVSNSSTTFSGAISQDIAGRAFTTAGTGNLTFSGAAANTYTGNTTINAGTLLLSKTAGVNAIAAGVVNVGDGTGATSADVLRLGASNQIHDTLAFVQVNQSGQFDLNGFSETINGLTLVGDGNVVTGAGTLTLGGNVSSTSGLATETISGNLNLGGVTRTFSVSPSMATVNLDISAVIANGGITKSGAGILRLGGGSANTYTGTTTVNDGTLVLAKMGANGTILGDLIVGAATSVAEVNIVLPNQIANSANVTVNDGSNLMVSAAEDGFGLLTLNDGGVTLGAAGSLTLTNNVVVNAASATNTIDGLDRPLILSGAQTFTVADGSAPIDLDVTAVVQSGTLVKDGLGTMRLSGNSQNTAGATINAGTLIANKSGPGAMTGNVVVGDGVGGADADILQIQQNEQLVQNASDTLTINSSGLFDPNNFIETIRDLIINGGHVGAGTLNLAGSVTSNANTQTALVEATLNLGGVIKDFAVADGTAAVDLDITGAITNGSLKTTGAGTMRLTNTADNSVFVTAGGATLLLANPSGTAIEGILDVGDGLGGQGADVVRLEANNQLADSATAVSVQNSGLLDLNGFSDTVGALYLSAGTITTGAGTLSLAQFITTFANPQTASITGSINLGAAPRTFTINDGAPAIDLAVSGTITAGPGGQLIKAGSGAMQLNTTAPLGLPVVLNAGTLTGTLTIGPIGSLTQNAGTTYSGTLTNQGTFTYNGGTFAGQLINEGTTTFAGNFTAGNGIINFGVFNLLFTQSLTTDGTGLDNQGTITLASGTLGGNGPLVNNASLSGSGTIAGSAGFANNGLLTISGGNISLTNSGANANAGLITVPFGLQLRLLGGNLTNTGIIDLDGGSISGAGTLVNAAGGTVQGGSSVQSPMSNDGGLIHANAGTTLLITNLSGGNVNGGELRIADGSGINVTGAFASGGTIVLSGANAQLIGGAINNTGTLRGSGRVSNSVQNGGTVLAESGRLTLSGSGHTNAAAGIIEAHAAAEVFYSQGLAANNGQIALAGGTFDNNNRTLDNNGSVAGDGVIRTGGLTNDGSIGVGGGDLDLVGPVTNNTSVSIQSGSTARFFGPVNGPGNYPGTGTVMFLNSFSPGSSPAQVSFGGNLVFGGAANLTMELTGTTPGTQFDRLVLAGSASLAGALNVVLLDDFMPAANDAFEIITAAGGVSGTFTSETLPVLAADLEWDVIYGSNNVTLQVLSTVLLGDYNHNGRVDAADYTVWRDTLGSISDLAADGNNNGSIDDGDYTVWKSNFGQHAPGAGRASGANTNAAVPEPATLVLLMFAAASWCLRRRRGAERVSRSR